MTHFAIPDGVFSPAEAGLASVLDDDATRLDRFVPLGLLLFARDCRFTVVLIATATGTGFDADDWWAR